MIQIQNNKRAVIYCRVSTKEQVEEGNSLITQENNCREYALKNGYDITEVFIEQGESAKTADRTELQKLLAFCAFKKNDVQAVIAYKIDRISRNTDDYSQIRILLKRHNVEIKSTSEYFENTPAGRFMENIMANVAQFDNDVRTERSVGGMVTAMREGRYVWNAPVGYVNQKVNGKTTIVLSEKASLVRMVFEAVANRIDSVDDIRTKVAPLGLCAKSGKPLNTSYFYRILKNETYAGWIIKFGEKHRGNFEPIISELLFSETQLALSRRKGVNTYNLENPDFPLRRFITHFKTNEKLTGGWSSGRNKKYAYYRFKQAKLEWAKDSLEDIFSVFFDSFSLNENLFNALKKEIHLSLKNTSDFNQKTIEILLVQEKALKEKRQALVEKNLAGVINDSLLKENIDLIEEELWKIKKAKEDKNQNTADFGQVLDFLHNFLIHPSEIWKKLPFHIKLKLQWFVFPKGVTLENSEIRTTEICSIFKLKEIFWGEYSPNVHLKVFKLNTPAMVNSPPFHLSENIALLEDIKNDLIILDDIIKDQKKESGIIRDISLKSYEKKTA